MFGFCEFHIVGVVYEAVIIHAVVSLVKCFFDPVILGSIESIVVVADLETFSQYRYSASIRSRMVSCAGLRVSQMVITGAWTPVSINW